MKGEASTPHPCPKCGKTFYGNGAFSHIAACKGDGKTFFRNKFAKKSLNTHLSPQVIQLRELIKHHGYTFAWVERRAGLAQGSITQWGSGNWVPSLFLIESAFQTIGYTLVPKKLSAKDQPAG